MPATMTKTSFRSSFIHQMLLNYLTPTQDRTTSSKAVVVPGSSVHCADPHNQSRYPFDCCDSQISHHQMQVQVLPLRSPEIAKYLPSSPANEATLARLTDTRRDSRMYRDIQWPHNTTLETVPDSVSRSIFAVESFCPFNGHTDILLPCISYNSSISTWRYIGPSILFE
jgi:hypothetical protein